PPPPPPAPEAAPPPPPPPPPPPVVECNKGPYIVFFDWDKSDVTPEAATILDSAVSAYANCSNVPIMLAGYTDRSGTVQYNLGLSQRRNASVTSYLTSHGIPGGAISSQAFGEANPRVPTADGVRELQNRRVEITYGPGSGQ
ncbi:OmpA/MotB, partial [Novosphingobium sp. Rr 2-17]|uniref:OmpA family protein n=1 Tax=Novosphingobium sp. Rr 2-17 TaxID=555793 RepID=UPI000269984E